MKLLKTPRRTPWLLALIWCLVLSGVFMVPYQYFWGFGTLSDHFFTGADAGSPICLYWFPIIIFELEMLKGWRFYKGGDPLFAWCQKQPKYAAISNLLTVIACMASIISLIDAIRGGMYYSSLYFALRIYAFLLLRCSRLRYYDDDEHWLKKSLPRHRSRHQSR